MNSQALRLQNLPPSLASPYVLVHDPSDANQKPNFVFHQRPITWNLSQIIKRLQYTHKDIE